MKKRYQLLAVAVAGSLAFGMLSIAAAAEDDDATASTVEATAATSESGLLKAGPASGGTTEDQPFPEGTGGSDSFRIPSLVTLEDGTLVAAADARYDNNKDGGGLDTIFSVSTDGGTTWEYSFPIYFPDSDGYASNLATTIIDPVMVVSGNTIMLMADVNPTGVTTMNGFDWPGSGTGYITVDGIERLALTSVYENADLNPKTADESAYEYYVGDLESLYGGEYAVVYNRDDNTASEYLVDEWCNLYVVEDGTVTELSQTQVNSDTEIQQNVYYADSELHVYKTGYMWQLTSTDGGKTWSRTDLNPQIKTDEETALLVSPGHGTVTADGTIIIPFYSCGAKTSASYSSSSFIFSTDGGATWTRSPDVPPGAGNYLDIAAYSTGESEAVVLEDGTVRLFVRAQQSGVCYNDAVWDDETGNYKWLNEESYERLDDIDVSYNCKVSALVYSEKINGQQCILFSCPAAGAKDRKTGKIYVFLLDDENNMTLHNTYDVTGDGEYFAYSCLTEQSDGSIGLLWEHVANGITYSNIQIVDLLVDGDKIGESSNLPAIIAAVAAVVVAAGVLTILFTRGKKKKSKKTEE